jgi:hypothetical protein
MFWLFTYALLSFRAEMALGSGFELFSGRRILATSVGAAIFGLVLRRIGRPGSTSAAKPMTIIATVVPASLAVLAARLILDHSYYQQPLPLEDNVRWVLVWAGYFGLWVSAALALGLHAESQATRTNDETLERSAFVVAKANLLQPAERPSADTLSWVVDAIADELAAVPPRERRALLDSLVSKAGYEIADELDPSHPVQNARVKLVRRLVRRMAQQAGS